MEQKLILFDIDGTLLDSRNIILRAMEITFKRCNITPPKPQQIIELVGISLTETMRILARNSGAANPESHVENLIRVYRESFAELRNNHLIHDPMFEGAHDLITELAKQDNLILGIATGKSRRGVTHLLERENLNHFTIIQTADDAPSKPNPTMIYNALNQSGVKPENALFIGDTTFDMEMANSAAIRSIAVLWGYHTKQDLIRTKPHAICKTMHQLKAHIIQFITHTPTPS